MVHLIKISAVSLLVLFTQKATCQKNAGMQKLSETFSKVMAFSNQPYLHYSTVTKMTAAPVFEQKDTATLTGEFYKYKDDFYSTNGAEENYVQDSFLVQVNHEQKSIWISKVDTVTKKRIDMLPQSFKQLLLKRYDIKQSVVSNEIGRMDFSEKQQNTQATAASFGLEYDQHSFSPTAIEIKAIVRQASSDELLAELEKMHIDSSKLLEVIDGVKFLVRTQQMLVAFIHIDNTIGRAMKMPSWKKVLDYDALQKEFLPTAAYGGYTVTPTF